MFGNNNSFLLSSFAKEQVAYDVIYIDGVLPVNEANVYYPFEKRGFHIVCSNADSIPFVPPGISRTVLYQYKIVLKEPVTIYLQTL
jgi:hypothetical protein